MFLWRNKKTIYPDISGIWGYAIQGRNFLMTVLFLYREPLALLPPYNHLNMSEMRG